jgi:hypothetical protein
LCCREPVSGTFLVWENFALAVAHEFLASSKAGTLINWLSVPIGFALLAVVSGAGYVAYMGRSHKDGP